MTRALNMPFIAALALSSACVLYDDDCKDDPFWSDDDGRPGLEDGDDADLGASMWLTPDTVVQGETVIVGVQTEDLDFDFATVTDVVFYGDVTPCTMQSRDDELLITIVVDEYAELGSIDMLLELSQGGAIWVDDALFVIDAEGNGGDGNADDGSGSDGSGSDGSGSDGSSSDGSSSDGSGSDGSGSDGSGSDGSVCG